MTSITSGWECEIPAPKLLNLEEKKKWDVLPLDKKITAILEEITKKKVYNDQDKRIAQKCWNKSSDCRSGKTILEIGKVCFQISEELRKEENNPITIYCKDGLPLEVPHFYMPALAKDSNFFRGLFFGGIKETAQGTYVIEPKRDQVKRLLEIWAGGVLQSDQEAYDLLEASNELDLIIPAINNVLVRNLNTWPLSNDEDLSKVVAFGTSIANFAVVDEVKKALSDLLVKAYLQTYGKGEMGFSRTILEALKQLDTRFLKLDSAQLNDIELQNLIKNCPNLNSLFIKNAIITNQATTEISKLTNLTSLSLSDSMQLTDQAAIEINKLANLTSSRSRLVHRAYRSGGN